MNRPSVFTLFQCPVAWSCIKKISQCLPGLALARGDKKRRGPCYRGIREGRLSPRSANGAANTVTLMLCWCKFAFGLAIDAVHKFSRVKDFTFVKGNINDSGE